MTVAKKIRSLTDKEMARWITKLSIEYTELFFKTNFPLASLNLPAEEQRNEMREGFLEELKKEAIIDE